MRSRSTGSVRPLSVLATLAGWPRRLLAVGLLLFAALTWVQGRDRPTAVASNRVVVLAAARDMGAGSAITAADLQLVRLAAKVVPDGELRAVRAAVGRRVAGAIRRGEPITDVRLVGPGLTSGMAGPDTVAVPVRVADGETAAILRAGDRVDLLATPASGAVPADGALPGDPAASARDASPADGAIGPRSATASASSGEAATDSAVLVAAGVRVLAVLTKPDAAAEDGVLVLVAAPEATARRLAGAAAEARLSVTLRPP